MQVLYMLLMYLFVASAQDVDKHRIVVDLVDNATPEQIEMVEQLIHTDLHYTHLESMDEKLMWGRVENVDEAVRQLKMLRVVEAAEPTKLMYAFSKPRDWPDNGAPPDDPLYEKQWHLKAMGAPYGWMHSPMGEGVIVAVIDTGVAKVQDLADTNVLAGESFVPNETDDGNGHGTHVAGTIAQSTNNGIGVAGVAPKATILPVKVLTDAGYGQADWIAAGIDYAVDNGAQVINLSLGGGYSEVIHNAVKKATQQGVVVVAACGNSSVPECGYPGGLEETIGVSATGPDGKLAFYSSYGKGVNIAAPGGNKKIPGGGVWQNSIVRGKDDYYEFQGTSMATPHVAGALAVLISTGVTPEEASRLILDSATPDEDKEKFGNGHLNLENALKQRQADAPVPHKRSVTASDKWFFFRTLLSVFMGFLIWKLSGIKLRTTELEGMFYTAALMSGGYIPLLKYAVGHLLPSWMTVEPFSIPYAFGLAPNIIWSSVFPTLGVVYLFALDKRLRPFVLGAMFAHAGWLVTFQAESLVGLPWSGLIIPWQVVNFMVEVVLAMGVLGMYHLEKKHNK